MNPATSPALVEALRKTLAEVERALELRADDPRLHELKQTVARILGEMEAKRSGDGTLAGPKQVVSATT